MCAVWGRGSRCQCGCKDSVATCSMLECSFSKPAKLRIAQMQAVGMSDEQIIQAFVPRLRPGDLSGAAPTRGGGFVPYASVLFGLAMIWLFVKRYRKPKALAEIGPDPALDKYKTRLKRTWQSSNDHCSCVRFSRSPSSRSYSE